MKATVSEKGQVTIPKPIRDRMGIRKGQVLSFESTNGTIVVRKVFEQDPIDSVVGIINLHMSTDKYIEKIRGKAKFPR